MAILDALVTSVASESAGSCEEATDALGAAWSCRHQSDSEGKSWHRV